VAPNPSKSRRQVAAGHIVKHETQRDAKPEQERYHPILIILVQNERGDPPAGKEEEVDQVEDGTETSVESLDAVYTFAGISRSRVSPGGHDASLDLFSITILGGRQGRLLVNAVSVVVVLVQLVRDIGRVHGGARGVNRVIVAAGGVDTV
jgi:hypothetical protein